VIEGVVPSSLQCPGLWFLLQELLEELLQELLQDLLLE
jgi:hypothetical protein